MHTLVASRHENELTKITLDITVNSFNNQKKLIVNQTQNDTMLRTLKDAID